MDGSAVLVLLMAGIGVIRADTCQDMTRTHSSTRSVQFGIVTSPASGFVPGESVNVTLQGKLSNHFQGFKCQARPVSSLAAVGQWQNTGDAQRLSCSGAANTLQLTGSDLQEYHAIWRATELAGTYSVIEFMCYFYDMDAAEHYFVSHMLTAAISEDFTLPPRRTPPREESRTPTSPPTDPHTGDHDQTGVHDPSQEDQEKPAVAPEEHEAHNPETDETDIGPDPNESPSDAEAREAEEERNADEQDNKGAMHETKTEDELAMLAEKKKQNEIDQENKANEDSGAMKELQYEKEHQEAIHWEEMEFEIRMKKEEDERQARIEAEIRDKEEYDRQVAQKPDIVINVDEEVSIIEEEDNDNKKVTAGSTRISAMSAAAMLFLSVFILL